MPALLALQRRGITNYKLLLKNVDRLPAARVATAVYVLGSVGKKDAVPKLLRMLRTKRGVVLWDIRNALTKIGGQQVLVGLQRILSDKRRSVRSRFEACYGLAHELHRTKVNPAIFFSVIADKTNNVRLRGLAVEGVAIRASHQRFKRRRISVACTQVLVEWLHDSRAEVRFWAVFGMACLGVKRSLPILQKLAREDHETASLGWSVAEEAKDVIQVLRKGRWPRIDAAGRRQARRILETENLNRDR